MMRPPVTPTLGLALTLAVLQTVASPPTMGAEARTIRVTKADCARLVKYVGAPDVEYEPGVDVRGNPVTPPDLYGGSKIELPETVTIPIEVDLFDRLNLPSDRRYEGDVQVGTVRIDVKDGHATFNGQPLTPEEQAELARKCQEVPRGEGEGGNAGEGG
ncbi:hypothetical protein [Ferruginivarius sediminum]|nr:hypothetical protein [Ferruginivarius sediminum]